MNLQQSLSTCFLLMAGLANLASAQVTVVRTDPNIQNHTFDRDKPPKDMPKLAANESARTQTNFRANTQVSGTEVDRRQTDTGVWQVSMKIDKIEMTLRLDIAIWVPSEAVPKIINHEEGHRALAEIYYRDADKVAQGIAQSMLGQTVTASGSDAMAAGKNALKRASDAIGEMYLRRVDVPCGRAQDLYDEITAHGTNAIKEDRAVKEAIERQQGEQLPTATTKNSQ